MATTKNNYSTEEWAAQTSLGRKVFALRFHFQGREIPGMQLYETAEPYMLGDLQITEYYWQEDANPQEAIKVDVIEAPDWISAQRFLLTDLQSRMGINLPEASRKKIAVGDVAYVSDSELTQSIVFSRANLVIKVNSIGRKPIDVTPAAEAIDKLLGATPRSPEKGIGPRITAFSLGNTRTAEGKPVPITIEGFDPLEKSVWYRFHAEHGHFKRTGKKLEFTASRKGEQTITVHAFNAYGASDGNSGVLTVE
jgi:hypothetical protein